MQKNILITGASSGIGKAISEYLITKGHHVLGTSRKPSAVDSPIELITLDVTDEGSVKDAFEEAVSKLGSIDVLVNNAGFGIGGPLENTSLAEAQGQFETNYFGVVRMTNQALPYFKAQKKGMVINISSLGGLIGLPFQGHYSASKFALEGYCEALRIEVKPFNIKVCNICPADFNTPFSQNRRTIAQVGDEYAASYEHFLNLYEEDEKNGAEPEIVARLIHRLMQKRTVKPRYVVGKLSQTMGVPFKRLLGSHLFEKLMEKIWKVS